ncbi:MAG: hypothetical protein IJ127_19910 [Afipia sp.]|jgi:hypothetical protein|nr:hypothetical protein [Afipia sp.]WIG49732.1 MAG: hypothetical protein OJF48_000648 [Afipia sp.]
MSIAGLDHIGHKPGTAERIFGQVPAWLWFGAGLFLLMVIGGNRSLQDADTYWQIVVGQSIIDHRALPHTDVYSFTRFGAPWMSSSWLAQVLYAASYAAAGWAGPVILAALGTAAAFALLVHILCRYFSAVHAIIVAMAAVLMSAHHFVARPHLLALPVMVAWVYGLVKASDARRAPSLWLLPLIILWANLHGGFVLGLALIAPFALDALWNAQSPQRFSLALRWAAFGICALVASWITPYGWNSLLAARQILDLGPAMPLIAEWQAADFSSLGVFEICLFAAVAGALWRGIVLSPPRILLVLGLLHMALSHNRNIEVFALLTPLVVAGPLAAQLGRAEAVARTRSWIGVVAVVLGVVGATTAFVVSHTFTPMAAQTPAAAVDALKARKASRILHNAGFGGYLITQGIPTFFDGRGELYGAPFLVKTFDALALRDVDGFLGLLDRYRIDATLLTPDTPAAGLLDRLDGWQRIHTDGIAVVHVRKSGTANPAIKPEGAAR